MTQQEKARFVTGLAQFLYKDLGQLDLAELILRSTYERMETLDLPVNQISTLASLGRVAIARRAVFE